MQDRTRKPWARSRSRKTRFDAPRLSGLSSREAAQAAAPYLHGRLASVEQRGTLTVSHEERVAVLAAKLAELDADLERSHAQNAEQSGSLKALPPIENVTQKH